MQEMKKRIPYMIPKRPIFLLDSVLKLLHQRHHIYCQGYLEMLLVNYHW